MASKTEKIALGLAENASDEEVLARIDTLVAASEPVTGDASPKIALVSITGLDRYIGGIVVPPGAPIVLNVSDFTPAQLADVVRDNKILAVRSDSPLTPAHEVRRYAN